MTIPSQKAETIGVPLEFLEGFLAVFHQGSAGGLGFAV